MNPPPQPRVPSMNFDWEIRNTIEKIQLLSRWDILLTKPRETRGRYPQHSCDYVSVSIFSFATDSCGARTPTSPYDFEANFPALVVLGFNLFHSLRQLSIWNVRNKEWSIEAPSCEPVLLLKFFLFSVSDLHSTFSFGWLAALLWFPQQQFSRNFQLHIWSPTICTFQLDHRAQAVAHPHHLPHGPLVRLHLLVLLLQVGQERHVALLPPPISLVPGGKAAMPLAVSSTCRV